MSLAVFDGAKARLVDATVVNNDGLGVGYDITSTGRVRLVRTTCGRSARLRYPHWRRGDYETVRVVGSFGCASD